jgi:hypothetical protein
MLIKDDCEKYSNEDDENKVADHGKKQGFRRTLDGQASETISFLGCLARV